MTRRLYLSSISIDNFRPFRRCRVRVPSPGVLILAGPNGLGKSSFFDAIEWGLTGGVKRLRGTERTGAENLYARRRRDGSISESFGVGLKFSPAGEIQRTASQSMIRAGHFESAVVPERIASLLQTDRWSLEISDAVLSTYLHQTHWFCQSATERFVYRDAQERWNDIEGPAGVKKMMAIQRGLGKNTKTALTKRSTQLERDVTRATEQLRNWSGLITRRETLKSQIADGGGLSPNRADESLGALEMSLDLPAEDRPAGTRLQRIFQHLQTEEVLLSQQRSLVDEAKEIVNTFGETTGAIAELEYQCAKRQQTLEEILRRIESLRTTRAGRQKELESVKRTLREHEHRIEQLTAVKIARSLGQELSSSISNVREQTRLIRMELTSTRRQVALFRDEISRIESCRRQRQDAQQQLREVAALDEAVARLVGKLAESQQHDLERRSLSEEVAEIETDLVKEREELLAQEEAVDKARDELALETQRRDAIKAAVSTIVANIAPDEGTCPVCSSTYAHEELHRRMEEALRGGGEELVRLERKIVEEEEYATEIRDSIDLCVRRIRALKLRMAELARAISETEQMRGETLSSHLLAGLDIRGDMDAVGSRLASARAAAEGSLRDLPFAEAENVRFQEVERTLAKALETERILESREASAIQEMNRLEARKHSAEAILRTNGDVVGDLDVKFADALALATGALEKSRLEHQALSAQEEEIASSVQAEQKAGDVVRIQFAELKQLLDEQRKRQASLLVGWRRLKVGETISNDGIATLESRCRVRNELLAVARMKHKQIADGIAKWMAEAQLNEADEEIEKYLARLGVETLDEVSRRLEEDLRLEQKQLEVNQTVINGVAWLDSKVKESMDSYVPNLLAPLNHVAGRVFDALSIFPGQQVQMQAPRRSSVYPVSLRVLGDFAGETTRLSPEDMLSEGQLSFVSLGIMISMSLVYRWSDWRCLLLDDPFQNNDIVHIAALLDLLRGLSLEMGYQIILSTHDVGLADYLRRKFLAGNVETVMCRLVSATDDGVILEQ